MVIHCLKACFVSALLLLTGCASQWQVPQPARLWQNLQNLQSWSLKGQVAIHTTTQGSSFSVIWQQLPQQYTLNFFGPLGLGHALLQQLNQQEVALYVGNKRYTAASPDILLQQQLGWPLPVTNLYYWIRGIPAPHWPSQVVWDENHHLIQTLSQQGWIIQYLHYRTINKLNLPDKISLQHDRLQVKIIIRQWDFPAA
jgi:outer membrane lipoprotein LolB